MSKEEVAVPLLERVRLRRAEALLCTPSLYHHCYKLSMLAILLMSQIHTPYRHRITNETLLSQINPVLKLNGMHLIHPFLSSSFP